MLDSIFGKIKVVVNEQDYAFKAIKLQSKGKNYVVDQRYKINIYLDASEDSIVECKLALDDLSIKSGIESGEELELISFFQGNNKLSIGVQGDIPDVEYEYLDEGIKLKVFKEAEINCIIFAIAWISMKNPDEEDIYTWFAADPTIFTEEDISRM